MNISTHYIIIFLITFKEPILFTGSLILNLDPLQTHTMAEIQEAVQHAHLSDFVNSLPAKLHYEIVEGGENIR